MGRTWTEHSRVPELLNALQDELAAALEQLPDPQPPFGYRIGWSTDYAALFRRAFVSETGTEEIVRRALASGRVLLHARGGSGKTIVLVRLLKDSLGKNRAAIFVDLRRWTPADYEA